LFAVNAHLTNAVERSTLKKRAKEKDESHYYLNFLTYDPQALLEDM